MSGERLTGLVELQALTDLDLSGTPVTNDTIQSLAKLPNLEALNLSHSDVTRDGLAFVAALSKLKRLDSPAWTSTTQGWPVSGRRRVFANCS